MKSKRKTGKQEWKPPPGFGFRRRGRNRSGSAAPWMAERRLREGGGRRGGEGQRGGGGDVGGEGREKSLPHISDSSSCDRPWRECSPPQRPLPPTHPPTPNNSGVVPRASKQLQPSNAFRAFHEATPAAVEPIGLAREEGGRRGPLRPRSVRRAAPWYWSLSGKAGCRPARASLPTRPPGFASRRGSDLRMAGGAGLGGRRRRRTEEASEKVGERSSRGKAQFTFPDA